MLKIFVAVLIFVIYFSEEINCARGGSRSSSRSSFRSSYRSSSVRTSTSYRSSSSRLFSSRTVMTASILGGSLYLGRSWRTRYGPDRFDSYTSYEICYNGDDGLPDDDATENSTALGYFICPLDDNMYNHYCCGPDDVEYCCGFWDKPGNLAGVIIGIVATVVLIAIITYCIIRKCYCNKKSMENSNQVVVLAEPYAPPMAPPMENNITLSENNVTMTTIGFKDLPPPYEAVETAKVPVT